MTENKPEDYAKSPLPPRKPRSDEWQCPSCTGINPAGRSTCQWCGLKAGGATMKFFTGKNPNVGISVQTPEFLKKGGREKKEPPTVLPKGTGILSSIVGALGGKKPLKPQPIVNAAMDEIINYKQEERARDERAAKIEKEYANEAEKARRAEVEAEELQSKLTQEKYDREKRKSFNKGEKSFGAFWNTVERETATERREIDKDKMARMERGEIPLDSSHTRCRQCFKIYDKNTAYCPYCRYPNTEFMMKKGKMLCPYCKQEISVHDHFCGEREGATPQNPKGYCLKENPGFIHQERLDETTSKRIAGKVKEMIIYLLAGTFVIFGLPFLGLPSLPLLGMVLIVLFPFYSFLPDEREVLTCVAIGDKNMGFEAGGMLFLKGMVKFFAFAMTVFQFFIIPISKLIPLALSFMYYFTLPTSYRITQPYKMLEAWLRIFVGALIAIFILTAFNMTSQAWSLFLMSLAFFATSFPIHKEAKEETDVVKVEIMDKAGLKYLKSTPELEAVMNIVYIVLMSLAGYMSGVSSGGNTLFIGLVIGVPIVAILFAIGKVKQSYLTWVIIGIIILSLMIGGFSNIGYLEMIFLGVWLLSLMGGLTAGREGRPAMGIMMITMTLLVFTFTATGVVGSAVFGYWWPQVEAFGEMVAAPIAPLMEQAQGSMSNTWLMLTNPMEYYKKQTEITIVKKSVVKTGGTTKSIELTAFELWPTTPGILDPAEPLLGSIEVSNQGEFDASSIDLTLYATYKNVTEATMPESGPFATIERVTCSGASITKPNPFAAGTQASCVWSQTTYPGETKILTFKFGKEGAWNPLHLKTVVSGVYDYGGYAVKFYADYIYSYDVNVSIPVEIIKQDIYEKKLLARDITLHSLESQYSGGPVKATLYTQKQPVRSGELSVVRASVINEGAGNITLNTLTYDVYVPALLAPGAIDYSTKDFDCEEFGAVINNSGDPWNGYRKMSCQYTKQLGPSEYVIVAFPITPTITTDMKTSSIVGVAHYEYKKQGTSILTVANVERGV